MLKRRQTDLAESSASLETEKILLKQSIKKSGLQKLRKEIEENKQVEKKQKDDASHKERYFACLLKNNIDVVALTSCSFEMSKQCNIENIASQFKKIKTLAKLNLVINVIKKYSPENIQEKAVAGVYLFVLEMHADRPWLFARQTISLYSEADFQYKFWSHIFEMFLGRKRDVMLRWGDTMSDSCKKTSKKFKLDLRLIVLANDEEELDGCTGEIAKKTSPKKIFKDKLKSIISTKCHLNTLIKSMPFLRPQDVLLVKLPIIQITGFGGKLSVLNLVQKKKYQLEEVCSFCFPQTLQQIQSGSLESLLNFLVTVEDMLDNLRKLYDKNSSSVESDIDSILSEASSKKNIDYTAWLTEPIFEKDE